MFRGPRSEQDKRTNAMKSSSSSASSHSKRMMCKCGDEVMLLKSSTKANPGKTFWRAVEVVVFFTGVMNLGMRRVSHA
ncbi:hypothetical protein SESBI_25174 [Sesbania bispinosa]|nr:hypothetical protein SESBI_25174 [Sesbania bispinosa]